MSSVECKECGSKYVVNKTYCLCDSCNQIRIHGVSRFDRYKAKELSKPSKYTCKPKDLLKPPKRVVDKGVRVKAKKKYNNKVELDEEFYLKVFNSKPHECEECRRELPDYFRDENGKVVARWQYSHIIPKSVASELRHELNNMNRLCLIHHCQWENGDKESMKIFKKNCESYPEYLLKFN